MVRYRSRWPEIALVSVTSMGCGKGSMPVPAAPLTPPTVLCSGNRSGPRCLAADDVEAWLRDRRLEILGSDEPPTGQQGAKVLTLRVRHRGRPTVFRAKWRPHSSATLTNDPRKELAAYAVQKLFLEPNEYVVPPTSAYCFDLAEYRRVVEPGASPSFSGSSCLFGILSYWLETVQSIESARENGVLPPGDGLLDEELFRRNASYRVSIANLNLLTYLIRHADAHSDQFLVSKEPHETRVYAVDNSMAFESIKNPMLIFRDDWSKIRVPALPEQSISKLEALSDEELYTLRVIAEFEKRDGRLVPVKPSGDAGADEDFRWVGNRLKLGLTRSEIDGVSGRLRELLDDVERGKLETF